LQAEAALQQKRALSRSLKPSVSAPGEDFLWHESHKQVRDAMGMVAPQDSAWLHGYCQRERELCAFFSTWVSEQCNFATIRAGVGYFFFNISESSTHNHLCFPGIIPPLMRRHLIAMICATADGDSARSVRYERHLLGLEHLFSLGFPEDIRTFDIADVELRALAGNSISVCFLVALFGLILTTDFDVQEPEMLPVVELGMLPVVDMISHITNPFAAVTKRPLPGDSCGNVWLVVGIQCNPCVFVYRSIEYVLVG
jgi:hypothetical protein